MAKSKKRKTARKYKPAPALPVIPESLKRYAAALDIPEVKQTPRLMSLLFCDFASKTDDGKMNLLGIFDRVYVHPEIRMTPPFVLYGRTVETFEDNLWLRIFDPDHSPRAEFKFDPPAEIKLARERDPNLPTNVQFIIPLQLNIQKQGIYWFDIAYRDYSLGGTGLPVMFRKIEEGHNATDTYL